ncbi:hypothetical protein COCON_G00227540 [Conger conger]|uniref:ADF-H domain-containing protein n=1 Tax=Conger conger TaxID=82655 RepID=A0A9Q1HN73_CONCO|nr:cofilin-2-like [Conger conger]KAJ8250832.1 hypothetical protein COCON_G00227540 [Conger conger]
MSSGVAIDPCVDEYINRMTMANHPSKKGACDRLKVTVLCINETHDRIVVDKAKTRSLNDFDDQADLFKQIMDLFEETKCCYAVYDCFYHTSEHIEKEELVFISWCPEDASIKDKMIYCASWKALICKFPAIKYHWQMCDKSDKDHECLVDKFGVKGKVAELEGVCLHGHK